MNDEEISPASVLTLISNENECFTIASDAIPRGSGFLENLIDIDNVESVEKGIEIEKCDSETLQTIIQFLELNKANPMNEITDPREGNLEPSFEENVPQEEYRNFVSNMELALFWKVRAASNFLGIDQLVLLTNVWLAFYLQSKDISEIHEILQISAMTREEEERAREAHPWLFQNPDEADAAAEPAAAES